LPTFQYTALNPLGQRVRGVVVGTNEQAALGELESKQLTPVSIEAKEDSATRGRRVNTRRLGMSYSQLADLLHAGVPMLRSLKVLGGRKSDPAISELFRQLADAVSEGGDLAASMEQRPDAFPPVHIAMVRAGEKGGFLEAVLARLGQLVLAEAELRSKIIGNLIYPVVLIGFGTLVLGVIFGVFIPKFRPMFDTIPGGPPWVTRFVFAISDAISTYGLVTLGVLIAFFFLLKHLSKRADVRRTLIRWKTFAPAVGPLVRNLAAARFCRMLGTMLANGVPMLGAMKIAKEAAGNAIMEHAIDQAAEAVKAGQSLAPPLAESKLFDDDVIEMISVGESANNLDAVLTTIAETIEARVDRLLSTLARLIEPLLLMMVAGVMVVVAVALILPMTQLSPQM